MSPRCPLCRAERARLRLTMGGWKIWHCPDCGLHFTDPDPSPAQQDAHYTSEADYYRDIMAMEPALVGVYRETVARIERHVAPGRLLDVGCGSGILMQVAAERGWQAEGVETSGYAAGLARERTGLPVHEGELQRLGLEPGAQDAVVMTQVVEHLVDPLPLLAAASALLRPEGVLCLATPNPESWLASVQGERFNYWMAPVHVRLYPPRAIDRLLREAGLRSVETRTWSAAGRLLDDRLDVVNALPLPRRLRRGRPARALAALVGPIMDRLRRGTITETYATLNRTGVRSS
ncbi:MAG: class I SAM-dependent methyltransferase [Candidatus Dormibacteria bacterium]